MLTNLQSHAQFAADKWGVRVFPTFQKAPVQGVMWKTQATTETSNFRELWNQANGFGIVLDGLTVIDIDDPSVLESLPQVEETLVVRTPRGFHAYLAGETQTKVGFVPGVDIKSGSGSYVVGPGSLFDDKMYWIIFDRPIAYLGDQPALLKWLGTEPNQSGTTPPPSSDDTFGKVYEGNRDNTMFRLACSMRSKGFSYEGVLAALLIQNEEVCVPPLSVRVIQEKARSACKYARGDRIPKDAPPEPEKSFDDYWGTNLSKPPEITSVQVGPWLISTDPTAPTFVIGKMKSAKSHIAMNIAQEWPGRVLYVATEGFMEMHRRVYELYPKLVEKHKDGKFYLGDGWPPVVVKQDGDLLIVDCLNPVITQMGFDESSSEWVAKLVDFTKQFDCPTVLVHHMGKDSWRGARGTSVSMDRVGTMYKVIKPIKNKHIVKMALNRYGVEHETTHWHFVNDALMQKDAATVAAEVHQASMKEKDQKSQMLIGLFDDISEFDEVTTKFCMGVWGVAESTARRRIRDLCKQGLLKKEGNGSSTVYKVGEVC